jgi:hypothetical protein
LRTRAVCNWRVPVVVTAVLSRSGHVGSVGQKFVPYNDSRSCARDGTPGVTGAAVVAAAVVGGGAAEVVGEAVVGGAVVGARVVVGAGVVGGDVLGATVVVVVVGGDVAVEETVVAGTAVGAVLSEVFFWFWPPPAIAPMIIKTTRTASAMTHQRLHHGFGALGLSPAGGEAAA